MARKFANLDAQRYVVGFYDDSFNPRESIPATAVRITHETHAQLLAGQAAGKRMQLDSRCRAVLVDWPPPTPDQLAAAARVKRDALLARTDHIVSRHRDQLDEGTDTDVDEATYRAWLAYRRALRDLTAAPGFPESITWPAAPDAA